MARPQYSTNVGLRDPLVSSDVHNALPRGMKEVHDYYRAVANNLGIAIRMPPQSTNHLGGTPVMINDDDLRDIMTYKELNHTVINGWIQ